MSYANIIYMEIHLLKIHFEISDGDFRPESYLLTTLIHSLRIEKLKYGLSIIFTEIEKLKYVLIIVRKFEFTVAMSKIRHLLSFLFSIYLSPFKFIFITNCLNIDFRCIYYKQCLC